MAGSDVSVNQSTGSTGGGYLASLRNKVVGIGSKRYAPVLIIALILLLAFFLRTFFVYDLTASNEWAMSGGSDSYYYHRLIEHAATTGEHLHRDPMLNFPDGARNPRPPLYTFSVAVPAVIFQPLFPSLDDSIGFFYVTSTAFWGVLTIIPVFLIAKEIFGRRTGYLAALFLGIMPADVEKTVASLCDHDAIALFFIVLTVYFLMKALKVANTSKWVDDWRSVKSIRSGFGALFANNRKAVLYALLAGTSFSCIAIAWVGFTYLEVILLAAFIVEIIINKFKGIDSTTHSVLYFVMFGFGFLLTFPVYRQMDLSNMDIPVYLFLAALFVGALFSVTRDMPWVVVMPLLTIFLGGALTIVTVVYPALGEAIFTGQGYFSVSKLYSTIAEAKAPIFSELALAFGMVTFYLSIVGLALMLWKVPKRTTGDYMIITIWMAVAIFMATSAARFIFNAAPAFALSCAWVTVMVIDRIDFRKAGKMMMVGSSGSWFQILRKSVKIRHIIGALFVVFLLITPNVWSAIDAGAPSEIKSKLDKQIYDSLPSFMRPADYASNSPWYLGSFGYSLPLPQNYFPAYWQWFAQQDSDIRPESARPAYVSWWDYGFESIDAGAHPAVADNFQQGYQIGGNILLASSEEKAIGMMIARMIANSMSKSEIPQGITDALIEHGASPEKVKDVVVNTSKYKQIVIDSPELYDPCTLDISSINVMWRYLGTYFANLTMEVEVDLYKDITDYLGLSIGYISVDSRLLPKSENDVGVFYAPCKLTDRFINEDGSPSDYFVIRAIDSTGMDWSIREAYSNPELKIVGYTIVYSWRFYETMLYRAYGGFSPLDAGKENNDGIPGFSGSTKDLAPMPGWNLTHFMMAYRTSYFNPENDGSGVWRAISTDLAIQYKQKIDAGEMDGIVDMSPVNAYQGGVVTLKYYDGAVLSGLVRTSDGEPASGIRLTVQDRWGIPHQSVLSDGDGIYQLIMPPGENRVVVTTGIKDTMTLVGNRELTSFTVNVTDSMAMRDTEDLNQDGLEDWRMIHNVVVPSGTLSGNIFWDYDNNGNFTSGDVLIKNASLIAHHNGMNIDIPIDASTGQFKTNLTTGLYRLDTVINGINKTGETTVLITSNAEVTRQIARTPGRISGTVIYEDGTIAAGVNVYISAEDSGTYPAFAKTVTDKSGNYSFDSIMIGRFSIGADSNNGWLKSLEHIVMTTYTNSSVKMNIMLKRAGILLISVLDTNEEPFANAHVMITDNYDAYECLMITVDENGRGAISVPVGTYSIIVSEPTNDGIIVGGESTTVAAYDSSLITIRLKPGIFSYGQVPNATLALNSPQALVYFQFGDTIFRTAADSFGLFRTYLPAGDYNIIFTNNYNQMAATTANIPDSLPIESTIERNTTITGDVWYDWNGNGTKDRSEVVALADVKAVLPNGETLYTKADYNGRFRLAVPRYSSMELFVRYSGFQEEGGIPIVTTSGDVTRDVQMELAPITMDGVLKVNGVPLGGVLIEFTNDTRYVNCTSDINGNYTVPIYPGIYEITIKSQIAAGSSAYYYYDKMIQIKLGVNIHNIEIPAEIRLKVQGMMIGVPSTSSVYLGIYGPTNTTLNVFGTYETYLAEGSYTLHAYDMTNKRLANISRFDLTSANTNISLRFTNAYEVTFEPQIGQMEGNSTLLRLTQKATGIVMNKTLLPKVQSSYSFVLPVGEYNCYFEMRKYEERASVETFYLLTNESDISITYRAHIDPIMKTQLDNSSLWVRVVDQDGKPISTEVLFLESDVRAIYNSYLTDANGLINSSIHPGPYTIYIADRLTGLTYFGGIEVRHLTPVILNITVTRGNMVAVAATAQGYTEIENMVLTIVNEDNGALIKNSDNFGTNSVSTLLPTGNYSILTEAQRTENGRTIRYYTVVERYINSDIIVNVALNRTTTTGFNIGWNSTDKATLAVGESVTYTIFITNTGNGPDSYKITSQGAGFDFSLPKDPVSVDFGSNNVAYFPVTITVNKDTDVDHPRLYIIATSTTNSSIARDVNVLLDVLPVYSVNATQGIGNSENSNEYYKQIEIVNKGNVKDNYTLTIINADELLADGWKLKLDGQYQLTSGTGTVNPGATQNAKLSFVAIRNAPKPNATAAVMVTSNSSTASAVVLVTPLLPDFVIQDGGNVTGDYVFSYDIFAQRDVENMILLVVMLALLASIFIIRKVKFGRFFR